MEYKLKPSLECMALVKIAATLWNQEDIRDLIKNCTPFNSTEFKKEWRKIEDKVKEKALQVPVPELINEKVMGIIKPIGTQISRWIKYYGDTFSYVDLPTEFCWMPEGTVDEKRTAKLLINDESIGIAKRYKISCIYCLENDIVKLWNEMPEDCKKNFYNEEDIMNINQPDLVVFWTYNMKGELSKVEAKFQFKCSPYQYACRSAAYNGNKAATEYFLQNLTSRERKSFILDITFHIEHERAFPSNKNTEFLYEYYSDILCTLLSHMDEEQRIEIFQCCPSQVLLCFLDWPWQSFFNETAKHLWTFLPENVYEYLLMKIIDKATESFTDFNYQKLLAEYWQQSPSDFKRYVLLHGDTSANLLSKLFEKKDEKNIKLILDDATVTEKQNIISSEKGHIICKNLIHNDDWSLVKFFIQECISSREEMIKFEADIRKRMPRLASKAVLEEMKYNWDQFFSLLDDISFEPIKKKFLEDNGYEAKRL